MQYYHLRLSLHSHSMKVVGLVLSDCAADNRIRQRVRHLQVGRCPSGPTQDAFAMLDLSQSLLSSMS